MFDNLEMRVLKTLITNKKHGLDFSHDHDAKLFSGDLWNFANLIVGYLKTHKELPTIRIINEKLSKGSNDALLKKVNVVWEQLQKIEIDDKEYKHDLDNLKKRFAEKQLLEIGKSLNKLEPGNIDINKSISELQKTVQLVNGLNGTKSYDIKDIKDYLSIFTEKFNAKKHNPNVDRGLQTGYSFLDYATNGIKNADFVIVAGETGFGKSLLLNNIAIQVWLQNNDIFSPANDNVLNGKNIIYFSLEMPYEDCFNRLLSRLSGVPSRDIENAHLNREEFNKVKQCLDFIKNYPYQFTIVDIADACANDLEVILTNSAEKYDAIFIDYLGIMKTNEKTDEQDWLAQGRVSYETRAICRKYNIPIFSAVQLNRKSPNKDSSENIGLSRLARSGTIATHATHILQIESRINEEKHIDFIYHIIKNRKGPKGKGILIKNLSCATLLDKKDDDMSYDNYFYNQDDISDDLDDLEL